MPARSKAHGAGLWLVLCTAPIFGFTILMLAATVWHQPPAPREPVFYLTVPGVDLSGIPDEQRDALLRRLNAQRCPCECMRTVASCRKQHSSCNLSLAEARALSEAARRPAPAARNSK